MPEPMTMMALIAAGQAALGAGQKAQSAITRRRAQRRFDRNRYQIPSSARAMLSQASSLATERGVPAEDIYRSRATSAVASGVEAAERTAGSSGDVLSVLQRLHGNYQDFEKDMAVQGADMYEKRQRTLMDTMMRFSQLETERWMYNELYPYMQTMGMAGQLDEAGGANIGSAMQSAMSLYGAQHEMNTMNEQYEKWLEMMMGEADNTPSMNLNPITTPSQPPLSIDNRTPLRKWIDPNR